jgi:uncharacterized protein (TIGR03437 family)
VIDSNPNVEESVQIPVFSVNDSLSCPSPVPATLTALLAPVSTVSVPTATDPVPRYIAAALGPDCQQEGDCSSVYFPILSVDTTPISLAVAAHGFTTQSTSVRLLNNGGSLLNYATSIAYESGANWLVVSPAAGAVAASASLQITANASGLQPGIYNATLTVNAGDGGTAAIPVSFAVGQAGVLIQAIVNAASFQTGPTVPGSYAALFGLNLAGTNVGVTFNGSPANIVYDSDGQINLIVPPISGQSTATVLATVDGLTGPPFTVNLISNLPGIFTPGILNSDNTVNSASNPARLGAFVQVYLTGFTTPIVGSVSVNIGNQTGISPLYAGAQPTLPGLDQVNVTIPVTLGFTGNSSQLAVCFSPLPGVPPSCSNSVSLYVQ